MTTVANINAGTLGPMSLDEIKSSIRGEFLPYMTGAAAVVAAKADAKEAAATELSGREATMTNIATLAYRHAWSPGMIEEAMGAIIEDYTASLTEAELEARKASIRTFKKDATLVCRPKVRADVSRIFKLAHEIFAADKKDESRATCKNAFARAYQTAIACFSQMKLGRSFEDARDIVQYASEALVARRYDGPTVAKKFEKIKADLRAFAAEYKSEYLDECITALSQLVADDFADMARAKMADKLRPATAPRPLNLVHEDVPEPVPAPVAAPVAAPVIAPVTAFVPVAAPAPVIAVPVPEMDAELTNVMGSAD